MALSRRRLGFAVVKLAASLGLLAIVLQVIDVGVVRAGLTRLGVTPWLGALTAFLVLHAASALKWRLNLALCGARLPVGRALTAYGAALFANLCLPSLVGGDLVRAGLAIRTTRAPEAVILGGVVDRSADVVALLALVAGGLLAAPRALERMESAAPFSPGAALLAVVVCFGVGVIVLFALRVTPVRRWPRAVSRRLLALLRASRAWRARPVAAAVALGASILLQSGFVGVNAWIGTRVGMHLDLALWFLLWPLAKIAAMLPVSLGGLGVREAAFAALCAPFADEALAVAQSLLWQTVLIAGGIAAGAASMATGIAPSSFGEIEQ